MAEAGNLTARILLRLRRKSTVKIRAGSLFRTPLARIGATGAAFQQSRDVFLRPPQGTARVHRMYTGRPAFRLARNAPSGAKSSEENLFDEERGDQGSSGSLPAVRLHEMCRIVTLEGSDFRQKFRSANFR